MKTRRGKDYLSTAVNTETQLNIWGSEQGFMDQMPSTGIWICGFSYMSEVRVAHAGIQGHVMRNIPKGEGHLR